MALKKEYNRGPAVEGQPMEEKEMGTVEAIDATAQGKELPPKFKKQMNGYKTVLSKMMHSKEMRGQTLDMLKSGPPEISVPNTALAINAKAEEIMQSKGIQITSQVKLAGSIFLVSDLVEVGNSGAGWDDPVDDEEAKLIYQDTLQDYIQKGLKDGSIDPIELQQGAEPLLNDAQKAEGAAMAEQGGVPMEVTQQQVLGNQQSVIKNQGQAKAQQPQGRG